MGRPAGDRSSTGAARGPAAQAPGFGIFGDLYCVHDCRLRSARIRLATPVAGGCDIDGRSRVLDGRSSMAHEQVPHLALFAWDLDQLASVVARQSGKGPLTQ